LADFRAGGCKASRSLSWQTPGWVRWGKKSVPNTAFSERSLCAISQHKRQQTVVRRIQRACEAKKQSARVCAERSAPRARPLNGCVWRLRAIPSRSQPHPRELDTSSSAVRPEPGRSVAPVTPYTVRRRPTKTRKRRPELKRASVPGSGTPATGREFPIPGLKLKE